VSEARSHQTEGRADFSSWLFFLWVASFPLTNFYLVAELSIDNLLVPILFVAWLFFMGDKQRKIGWSSVVIIMFVYLTGIAMEHRVFQGGVPFQFALWTLARDGGYFMLPFLFVTDRSTFRAGSAAIVIVAMAGGFTAILVSLGLLHLEYIRLQPTRIGLDFLPKATGVFRNFGDVALLAGYTVLVLLAYGSRDLPFKLGTRSAKIIVLIFLFLGLVGTQSRNMLVSMIVAVPAYAFFNSLSKVSRKRRQEYLVGAFAVAIVGGALIIFFAGDVISLLTNIGGGDAAHTAQTRLSSYDQAEALFGEAFVSGINYSSPSRTSLAELVHNLWIGLFLRGGIISVLSMAFFYIYAMRSVFRVMLIDPRNTEAKILGAFIFCAVTASMFFPAGSLIYWFMLGMIMTVRVTPLPAIGRVTASRQGYSPDRQKPRVLM